MVIGAFGPWARVLFISASGVDGDGWFVIGGAVIGAFMVYRHAARPTHPRWTLVVAALASMVALAVVVYDGKDIVGTQGGDGESLFGDADLISPGWGLWVSGLASASLTLASLRLLFGSAPQRDVAEVAAEPGESDSG